MNEGEKWGEIIRASATAILQFLHRSMVGIVVMEGDTPREVGSGTCIQLDGRFYVATAAHVLENAGAGQIRIVADGSNRSGVFPIARILRSGGELTDDTDLALIEVIEATASSFGKTFLDESWIDSSGGRVDDKFILLAGYPAETLDTSRWEQQLLILKCNAFHTFTLLPDKWPQSARPRFDIVFDYPPANQGLRPDVPVPKMIAAPGFSGGGIWITKIERDAGIWDVSKVRLVAIMRSWKRSESWARATQIEHLVSLHRANATG